MTSRKTRPKKPAVKGNIVWMPQARQMQMRERPEFEALYGGAAGGGKRDYLGGGGVAPGEIPPYPGN